MEIYIFKTKNGFFKKFRFQRSCSGKSRFVTGKAFRYSFLICWRTDGGVIPKLCRGLPDDRRAELNKKLEGGKK
jgi:hypothetical protein